jgi:hypothetical protein
MRFGWDLRAVRMSLESNRHKPKTDRVAYKLLGEENHALQGEMESVTISTT